MFYFTFLIVLLVSVIKIELVSVTSLLTGKSFFPTDYLCLEKSE